MDLATTRIGERGQVVIPQDFRRQLKLKTGEKLLVVLDGNRLVFEPVKLIKADSLEELRKDLIDISIAQMRLREIEAGHYEQYSKTEFLDKLEIWKKNR